MRHWMQYHNPDEMGEYDPAGGDFVVMKKDVRPESGDRVWLLSRRGKKGRYEYLLCMTFVAESSGPNHTDHFPDLPYCVMGSGGKQFVPPIPIDKTEEWFKVLFGVTQHFRYGLTHITDDTVIRGLSRLAKLP